MRLPTRRSSRTVWPSALARGGAQQEGAGDANVLEGLADDAWLESGDVSGNVGQFGHED
jgi:hypothetical protein